MSATHVLKHTPSAAASNASDQNAQTTFPIGLLGKEQLRIIGGPPNHCMAHPKHSGLREAGPAASSHGLRPLSINSEEDDGGGGTRVKKKRRKKDKKESEWHKDEESNTKPKRREQKEGKELLARKAKVAKEQKDHKKREPKAQKEVKKVKKVMDIFVAINVFIHFKIFGNCFVNFTVMCKYISFFLSFSVQKRRSGRQVKRRKYNEDLDFKVVDDDGETIAVLGNGRFAAMSSSTLAWQAEEPPEDEANIIEKILSARTVKKEVTVTVLLSHIVSYEAFLIASSYLHCKWATLEELEKDPRISQKMKRFRNKQAQMKHIFTEPDEDLFNPDYIEVDRVLEIAITTDTETGEEVTHYLVKWCSLSYEESTWELQEDVDPVKIREFEDLKEIPEIKHVERPLPEQWQKLEKSREYRNGNQLREYQLEGMNWLLFNWYNRKNCILADEMGLGKTIQSITFLYEIFLMGLRGPFLIIAPLSTITNWEREFRTWTEINVIVYHGSQISRQMILQYEMYHRDEQGNIVSGQFKFHGIITTFEMIMADCPELKKLNWCCVVIDEAHRLKNRNCKLLEGLKLMNLEHKVLLTGTPLQNSVEELFSLLNFLEPSQFPSETTFLEEFGDLKTEEQVKKLQAILKPMMLRRLKDDVEKNLAPKEETIIEVELTNIQKKYYRAILEKNFAFLAKGANQHNMPNLINTMMELRKCCNHPYLITGAEEKILESFKKTYSSEAADFQLQAMIQAAGKLVLIDKLLPKLLAGGHKVLVFSQMVRCLDILEDYLIQRRYTYERIDGRVRGNLRQAAIDRFSKVDSDRFVFLLCTRAGGLGINLTAADTCIIFDSDWNPQNDLQAQARCHRIGQSKAVKVYRLITRNSYEREMFDKASLKLGLDKAVLQDINRKGSLNGVQQLSKMEVEDLLRKGAYGALMDEEDEGSKFCEEDIDQILQRRTQTITIQSEGKGSTFAKASFVSSGNRTDISLDDPNFWQKWAKIAELEIDSKAEKESLVIDTPRVRKQTRHYNSFEDDELMEFSELDSDSEERPCRTRRLSDRNRRYLRAECFRVEKNLLIFGWGRWKDILNHGRFKWHLTERDMEVLCRALLVYCVRHYKGDDKIKSFIWDLITPTKDGHNQALQNHSGLSAPVPRGRKGKKLKNQLSPPELKNADWLVHCNPEVVLQDDSYKKHLKQHCNKVLLRVRMLYYLKVEVLGEAANQALEGIPSSKLEVTLPDIDYIEIPTIWWDAEADKSLLIGVHKHGYERYNAMRADPALCFLERVGMPDVTALTVEQSGAETASDAPDSIISFKGGFIGSLAGDLVAEVMEQGRIQWPAGSALTARLRRLITAYQRYTRREPLRHDFLLHEGISPVAWQMGEFRHCTTEPDPLFLEWQRRWTRREQADFYRTVSSFGVVYDPEKKTFDWNQFRALARLERKTDESLERYFHSFVSMCRTACRLPPRKDEGNVDPSLFVEPITEERAARTLYRIELLRKVREQVLRHPLLGTRLQLCHPSLYLPVWWECGKHDRDLLIGVAKHGLSRTDFYILNDPQFFFLEAHRNYVHKENHRYPVPGLPHHHCCLYDANLGHLAFEEPYEKPLTEPEKVPLEESYDLTCDETLQEPCEGFQQDTAEQQLVEETCKEPPEPIEECNLTNTTLSTDYPMPSSLPSSPTTLPDTSVSPGLDAVPKQEFLVDPVVSDVKPEPDSTTQTPHLEQTEVLEVKDKIKDEGAKAPGIVAVNFTLLGDVDGPRFALPMCEMADSVHEIREPTIAQLLQEKALYSFSEWPKDRVIINRIDSVCHTILKGKWPSSSQQYDSPTSLANTCVPSSAHQRAGFLYPIIYFFINLQLLSQQERLVAPAFLPERKRPRRGFEFEAEVLAKPSHLGEKIQVGVPHRVNALLLNGWQDAAIDLSKPTELTVGGDSGPISQMSHTVQSAPHKITGIGSIQGSLGLDMAGILQAGLIHPVTGQIVNGCLRRDDSMLRQRRGRRRNVETPDLSFIKRQSMNLPEQQVCGNTSTPTTLPTQPPAPSPAPPPASETLNVSMDRETSQNANILHSFLERPKQRRHRCKDPSKLDVSSLTGEERVPVVHRNTGRRGFLPEGKFTRILSGPVCRDPGPRRRGRRPRSEMPKAPELAAAMGPLFMNGGLIGSMDLVSLPNLRNVPGIPLTGIMGFPHGFATAVPSGEDAKNGLSMLPMMLHSMAAVQPPMYSAHMSGMINQQLSTVMSTATASSTSASVTSTNSTTVTVTSTSSPADSSDSAPQRENASSPMSTENKEDAKQGGEEKKVSASVSTAAATSSSSSSITSTGSHLTFNPFLIPGMSHSLLYPHMFLPPGSIMALPTMPAADSTGSPKRKRKKVREEGAEEGSGNVGVESKGVKGEQTPEQKSQEGGMEEGGPDVNLAQVKDPSDPIKGPSEDKSTEEKDKNEMGEKTESNALNSCDGGD
uniref:Chromodomain helicase DNA binding protein 6 n=1 Tax=Sinocyclocheilus grahami TaxID=75366 RepID=A0A672PWZ6_SINGR